jgi:hypothetical protein
MIIPISETAPSQGGAVRAGGVHSTGSAVSRKQAGA